jgi:hypothetical protein
MADVPEAEVSLRRAQAVLDKFRGDELVQGNFDSMVLRGIVNLQSNGPGHCSCDLPVNRASANTVGSLHGGCAGISPTQRYIPSVLHR